MDDGQAVAAPDGPALPPALEALHDALIGLQCEDLHSVDSATLLSDVAALRRLLGQCEGEWLRRVAAVHTRGAAEAVGAGSTKAFLRGTLLMSPVDASRAVRTAQVLASTCPATATALAEASVGVGQAHVVAAVIEALPSRLDPQVRADGERALLEHAATLNPADLARVGRFFAARVDPDGVARDENEAVARSGITFASTLYGSGFARGDLDPESLALIQTAIEPLAAPVASSAGDARSAARRRLDALLTIVRHYLDCERPAGPRQAAAHLSVVVDHETRVGKAGASAANLEFGGVLSAEATRRLACDAVVTAVTVGPLGQVLDVGRRTRVVTPAIWAALVVRDQHCAFPGCDAPPSRCDAHHIEHWADGGNTSLPNLVLLCRFHHHRVLHDDEHPDRWRIHTDRPTGRPVFTPPHWTGRRGIPLPPLWRPPPAD